jgi:thiol-disulfide isomerase/thioredoxin
MRDIFLNNNRFCSGHQMRLPSRRHVLMQAAALAAAFASAAPATAQGTGYDVSPWTGPLSSLGLVDTTGKTWELADFKGRAVLINLWATWCEPCRAEMPTLERVANLYGPERLLVLAVNFREPPSRVIRFVQETRLTLPVLLDVNGRAVAQWGVKIFPTTLLVDSRGQPQQRVRGELDWSGPVARKLVDALIVST